MPQGMQGISPRNGHDCDPESALLRSSARATPTGMPENCGQTPRSSVFRFLRPRFVSSPHGSARSRAANAAYKPHVVHAHIMSSGKFRNL